MSAEHRNHTEEYLDTQRSVLISSPAGSGKTEKLSRRYVSLLQSGAAVERILCITFTEKAAAEMKQRILSIIARDFPELRETVRGKEPLMRISTIHAFCLKTLKRFSVELGLDPSLSVMDEQQADALWTEAVYECLMADNPGEGGFFRMIRARGLKGWGSLKRLLDALYKKQPFPEMILRQRAPMPDNVIPLMELFALCLSRYREKKAAAHVLDYNDLEVLAHEALALGEQAHNILYAFDEHTDHILVDEFQDTSSLQWRIVDHLTEEWRAGLGPKREFGTTPTIFLVGDDKQSIYLFRGANVGIFHDARAHLTSWLGDEYHYIEVRDNYRSLPAVVEFTNAMFSALMSRGELALSFEPSYVSIEARREGTGLVEVLLFDSDGSMRDTRMKEATLMARRIRSLQGTHDIYGADGQLRPARYEDMAILLNKRTHLALYEDALREHGIPFVVMKGVGFYEEQEVALMYSVLCLLADPTDAHAAFCVLRSPLFEIPYARLTDLCTDRWTLFNAQEFAERSELQREFQELDAWREILSTHSLSMTLEQILQRTGGWRHFGQRQRTANIRKFIAMVEDLEAAGHSLIEIREALMRQRDASKLPKANVSAEGMDAVRIMTVHAAKGLQFPLVFLPGLDESSRSQSGPIIIDDSGDTIRIALEEDAQLRKEHELFQLQGLKEEAEGKRLFYVAVTRARDYLFMCGERPGDNKIKGRLEYFNKAFSLFEGIAHKESLPFTLIEESALWQEEPAGLLRAADTRRPADAPAFIEPLEFHPRRQWLDVTAEQDTHPVRSHGTGRVVYGIILHRLLEELSLGSLPADGIPARINTLIQRQGAAASIAQELIRDMQQLLADEHIRRIILPHPRGYTELPFVLDRGINTYRGRIDRVVIENGMALIYDYKTFAVSAGELPEITKHYEFQMKMYQEAAGEIFSLPAQSFLLFTALPKIIEMK